MQQFQKSRNNIVDRLFKNLTVEEVEFFDFTTDEQEFVVNLNKHVFYKNIYAFVNRLKNIDSIRKKNNLFDHLTMFAKNCIDLTLYRIFRCREKHISRHVIAKLMQRINQKIQETYINDLELLTID